MKLRVCGAELIWAEEGPFKDQSKGRAETETHLIMVIVDSFHIAALEAA